MAEFKTRITKVTVTPGELFHERGFEVEIVDEAGEEFIQVRSNDTSGCIRVDIEEWPVLCAAIDDMVREIKENEERPEPPKEEGGDWIPWNGGECPVPDNTRVRYQMRHGGRSVCEAGFLRWCHAGRESWHDPSNDIIAYKVVD